LFALGVPAGIAGTFNAGPANNRDCRLDTPTTIREAA